MRLIDGDDLSATFLSRGLVGALTHRKIRFTAGDVRGIIEKQPTVDAVPVEWIKAKIESLRSQDNEFASLSARMIQAMLNDYGEDGERR